MGLDRFSRKNFFMDPVTGPSLFEFSTSIDHTVLSRSTNLTFLLVGAAEKLSHPSDRHLDPE